MDFYEEIKRLAKQKNTTIDAVMAAVLGVDWGAHVYQGWRRRQTYPKLDVGYKIAKELGVSVEHFFGDESRTTIPHRLIRIFNLLENFSDDEIKNLEVMLETMISNKNVNKNINKERN